MQNFIQSDIFFFVTTIAVVVVAIFFVVALVYVIRILKNIKDVSDIVKSNAKFLSGDLSGMRKKLKKLFDSLVKLITRKTKKR